MTKLVNSNLVNLIKDLIEMRISSEINQPLYRRKFEEHQCFALEVSILLKVLKTFKRVKRSPSATSNFLLATLAFAV